MLREQSSNGTGNKDYIPCKSHFCVSESEPCVRYTRGSPVVSESATRVAFFVASLARRPYYQKACY